MKQLVRQWKKLLIVMLSGSILLILIIGYCHRTIDHYSSYVYDDPAQVPAVRYGLLLGTSKYAYGRENLFYNRRIDAAVALYQAGKIERILVSGDGSREDYNEPEDIKIDLCEKGVNPDLIDLDYAGLSTLDSVLRAKLVFGLNSFIVISQRFQCERALYIADRNGIEAHGFAADDVSGPLALKVYAREFLARVKAVVDVEVLKKRPLSIEGGE